MSFRICHIRGVYQQSIKHLFITKPPEQGIIIMDSCSSGPQHKTFSQTRWICTWCIGFSTIPNASVNFPVGPVLTTRFTPRRRTTILAFVTSVSKTPLPWQIYSINSKFVIRGRDHVTWSCVMRNWVCRLGVVYHSPWWIYGDLWWWGKGLAWSPHFNSELISRLE